MDAKTIFSKLPDYYKENDTYKNGNGEGILERFLYALGLEFEEVAVDKINNLVNELDPVTASEEMLAYLGYLVGNPTDIMEDTETYRQRIIQAIELYKYRGTRRGYKILFNILGYSVNINVIEPETYTYDNNPIKLYDDGKQYDNSRCKIYCLTYDIEYSSIPGLTSEPLTSEQEEALKATIIKDIQPYNGILGNFTYI